MSTATAGFLFDDQAAEAASVIATTGKAPAPKAVAPQPEPEKIPANAEPVRVDPDGWHEPLSVEEYHAHEALGSTMLETFRRSRREFQAIHIAKTQPKLKPTEAMDFGSMVHIWLLQPDQWSKYVAETMPAKAPDGKRWNRRADCKNGHAEAWEKARAERKGRIVPKSPAVVEKVRRVVDAIHANERAAALLAQPNGKTEFAIFWRDLDTGLLCKCLVDWLAPVAFDLKTTDDATPSVWSRQIVNLGYHRKLAHYQAGINSFHGRQHPFVHVAAETSPPYRVGNYELDDREPREGLFKLGVAQRRKLLFDLKECLETNDWREPWERGVMRLSLPGWAFSEDQWQ